MTFTKLFDNFFACLPLSYYLHLVVFGLRKFMQSPLTRTIYHSNVICGCPLTELFTEQELNCSDLHAVFLDEGAVVLLREVEGDVGEVHGGVECGEGEGGDAARLVEGRVVVHGQHAAQPVLPQGGQQRPT